MIIRNFTRMNLRNINSNALIKCKPPLFALIPIAKSPGSCVENQAVSAHKLTINVITPNWIESCTVLRNITSKLPKMFDNYLTRRTWGYRKWLNSFQEFGMISIWNKSTSDWLTRNCLLWHWSIKTKLRKFVGKWSVSWKRRLKINSIFRFAAIKKF